MDKANASETKDYLEDPFQRGFSPNLNIHYLVTPKDNLYRGEREREGEGEKEREREPCSHP